MLGTYDAVGDLAISAISPVDLMNHESKGHHSAILSLAEFTYVEC
jgi:hypothetical protein